MKKRTEFIPPSLEEVVSYFINKGYPKELAARFYGYSENDWRDSNNKPIKSWKLKAAQVWFTEKNKPVQVKRSNFEINSELAKKYAGNS